MDAFDALFEGDDQGPGDPVVDPVALIADALGRLKIPSVSEASLTDRAGLVRLRAQLHAITERASTFQRAIDRAFVEAAAKEEATIVRTGIGDVKMELPAASYETQPDAMRDALMALVPANLITRDQVDAALTVIITTKPNHTKLNALVRQGGKRVGQAIEDHRRRIEPDRSAARPQYPKED